LRDIAHDRASFCVSRTSREIEQFDVPSSALHLRRRGPRRRTVFLLAASPFP